MKRTHGKRTRLYDCGFQNAGDTCYINAYEPMKELLHQIQVFEQVYHIRTGGVEGTNRINMLATPHLSIYFFVCIMHMSVYGQPDNLAIDDQIPLPNKAHVAPSRVIRM
eukprot:629148_1